MTTPLRQTDANKTTNTSGTTQRGVRTNTVTGKGLATVRTSDGQGGSATNSNRGANVSNNNYGNRGDHYRIDPDRNIQRIPPRDRPHMSYDKPMHFYGHGPHYYGYRVKYLPPHLYPDRYWGRDYYIYNGVYYRRNGSIYYVCRPPFGVCIDRALYRMELRACRFAYYNSVFYTYSAIDDNYRTIQQQNRIIAQNNAIIANQNSYMALNARRATSSAQICNRLGLIQSYAYANMEYFYDDGVFFIQNASGRYEVIVPPAGALVSELPDDYDVITLDGVDYYAVDDTVYRLTLFEGSPYLEVLGQMPASMYARFSR